MVLHIVSRPDVMSLVRLRVSTNIVVCSTGFGGESCQAIPCSDSCLVQFNRICEAVRKGSPPCLSPWLASGNFSEMRHMLATEQNVTGMLSGCFHNVFDWNVGLVGI